MRFLETFVWLAKLRNFRLTAEKLHTGGIEPHRDVQLLKIDTEMPDLPLVGSYRGGPESPLIQQIAAAAQRTAQDFARALPVDVARLPTASLAGDPWSLGSRVE